MRKNFIDNLRIICILLLVPFHTAMIFNNFGETFYINGNPSEAATFIALSLSPWWMQLLFVLAGMSTLYAFSKRTPAQYAKERIFKLLIPLVTCLVLVVPVQPWLADIFHNGYTGNYLEHTKNYLTLTDFGGYDGHFTPGHTWFILYLFVISMFWLPLLVFAQKKNFTPGKKFLSVQALVILGFPVVLSQDFLGFDGKSFLQFSLCFLAGYFVFADENVQDRLERHAFFLGTVFASLVLARCILHSLFPEPGSAQLVVYKCLQWSGILASLSLGKKFLDRKFFFTEKMLPVQFPFYLLHQSVVVAAGFFAVRTVFPPMVQFLATAAFSFAATWLLCRACSLFGPTRFLLGMKTRVR